MHGHGNLQIPAPGKPLKVSYTLSNKSGQNIASSAVAITLPNDVTYVSSISKPRGAAGTLAAGTVAWVNAGGINAGKSAIFTVQAKVC